MNRNPSIVIKSIVITFIILVIGILVYFFWHNSSVSGKYPVSIVVAPQDTTVIINGTKTTGDSEIYLAPGSYEYTVSRDNFKTITDTITVTDATSDYTIIAPLTPANEEGEKIMASKISEFTELEGTASSQASKEGAKFQEKNPIIKDLPYKNMLFTIGYRADTKNSDNDIIITIHASPIYYDAAITQIRNLGYNPAEFNIEIIGEENPFK